jgi:hypothetical protein
MPAYFLEARCCAQLVSSRVPPEAAANLKRKWRISEVVCNTLTEFFVRRDKNGQERW